MWACPESHVLIGDVYREFCREAKEGAGLAMDLRRDSIADDDDRTDAALHDALSRARYATVATLSGVPLSIIGPTADHMPATPELLGSDMDGRLAFVDLTTSIIGYRRRSGDLGDPLSMIVAQGMGLFGHFATWELEPVEIMGPWRGFLLAADRAECSLIEVRGALEVAGFRWEIASDAEIAQFVIAVRGRRRIGRKREQATASAIRTFVATELQAAQPDLSKLETEERAKAVWQLIVGELKEEFPKIGKSGRPTKEPK